MTQKFLFENQTVDGSTADADGVSTTGASVNIEVAGDLDGGTVTFLASLDNGTTRIPISEFPNGPAMASTAPEIIQVLRLASDFKIYATLTGSTSPDVTVIVVY